MRNIFQWFYYVLSMVAIIYTISTNPIALNFAGLFLASSFISLSIIEYKNRNGRVFASMITAIVFMVAILLHPHKWLFSESERQNT